MKLEYWTMIFLGIIFIIFFAHPFLTNGIFSYDGPGHIEQANFIKKYTWPNSIVWNPQSFFGYQANQFYPPLFYFIIATSSFLLDSEISVKFIILLSYVTIFLSIYLFSMSFFESKKKSIITVLIIFLIFSIDDITLNANSFYGLNFFSTIYGGLLPTVLSAAFLFSGLYYLEKIKIKTKNMYFAGILFGLSILTHFIGLLGLLFIFCYLITDLINKKKLIYQYTFTFVLSIGTCAWWLFPFLLRISFSEKAQINAELNVFFITFLLISIISSLVIIKKRKKLEITFISIFIILLISISQFIIETQIFRLLIIFFIFSTLQLIQIMSEKNIKIKTIIVFLLILIFIQTLQTPTSLNNQKTEYSIDTYGGLGLSVINLNNKPAHHQIAFVQLQKKDNFITNGLFVESSLSSVYVFMTLKTIDFNIPSWGVITYKVKEKDTNIINKQLKILGVSYIVSNIDFNYPKKIIGKQVFFNKSKFDINNNEIKYYLYDLNKKPIIEILPYNTISFNGTLEEWKSLNKKWFVDPSDTIFVLNGKVFEKKQAIVSDINYSSNYQSFSFTIDSNEPVAVYIRQSYYPTWHAYQGDKEIPIYLASPNFMIIEGQGKIEFKQEPDIAEYLGLILTGITIIILIIGLKPSKNPHL